MRHMAGIDCCVCLRSLEIKIIGGGGGRAAAKFVKNVIDLQISLYGRYWDIFHFFSGSV